MQELSIFQRGFKVDKMKYILLTLVILSLLLSGKLYAEEKFTCCPCPNSCSGDICTLACCDCDWVLSRQINDSEDYHNEQL